MSFELTREALTERASTLQSVVRRLVKETPHCPGVEVNVTPLASLESTIDVLSHMPFGKRNVAGKTLT